MRRRAQRLFLIAGAGVVLALAMGLTLAGLRDSVVYFVTPSELAEKASPGRRLRLGGLVVEGTFQRTAADDVRFSVTDGATLVEVHYMGPLPDLFREGQGVIAEGVLDAAGVFKADTVLAKHDETYMPKEVADALKKQGHWKDDYGAKPDYNAKPAATQGASQVKQGVSQ